MKTINYSDNYKREGVSDMRMTPYSFRLKDEMREDMIAYCENNNIQPSNFIRTTIEKFIKENTKNHKRKWKWKNWQN